MRKFYNYLQLFIKPNIFLFITLITITSCDIFEDKAELKIPFETQDYKLDKDFIIKRIKNPGSKSAKRYNEQKKYQLINKLESNLNL
jgi:hypothetical protein